MNLNETGRAPDAEALPAIGQEAFLPHVHPAISDRFGLLLTRVAVVIGFVFTMFALGGCAVHEHRDGMGYTVRYDGDGAYNEPPPRPRRVYRARYYDGERVIYAQPRHESHPVIHMGRDDAIPREFANYVSDRNVTKWRQRSNMCKEHRPGYCSAPNVAHCHGPFCHAHPGGDKRHTH